MCELSSKQGFGPRYIYLKDLTKGDIGMLIHWIWLAQRPKVTDRVKRELLDRMGDAEDIYHADAQVLGEWTALLDKDLSGAEKILAQCSEKGIQILTLRDQGYPAALRSISDPPLVLYHKGPLPDLDAAPAIGVVGTRKSSPYGLSVAEKMGYQIAKCGGVLVSGAAEGIDAAAMDGALRAGGPVIGVLGGGVDVVYPVCNRWLFQDMERQGCLISEYPPQARPAKWTFPRRNRIISGLSQGVLVVEAPERSGSLITARQALEQGRDVYVVPGNIDVPACAGSNGLLRDGATAVGCGWDILSGYEEVYPQTVRCRQGETPVVEHENIAPKVAQKPRLPRKTSAPEKKVIDNSPASPYIDGEKAAVSLSEEERLIVRQLEGGKRLADDVIVATGLPSGRVQGILTMLEVRGVIRRLPGNMLELK